ncbi:hypothetical protein N9M47_02690, partial [Candidatus Poseidoniales archaeon]|nr:hypothetical protein [Candidatus Poseidoniales archaeon]
QSPCFVPFTFGDQRGASTVIASTLSLRIEKERGCTLIVPSRGMWDVDPRIRALQVLLLLIASCPQATQFVTVWRDVASAQGVHRGRLYTVLGPKPSW